MREQEETRNNDTKLVFHVWKKLGLEIFIREHGVELKASFMELAEVPNFESIRRARQRIQNVENRFLPTEMGVIMRRRIREEQFREYYSNRPEMIERYEYYKVNV